MKFSQTSHPIFIIFTLLIVCNCAFALKTNTVKIFNSGIIVEKSDTLYIQKLLQNSEINYKTEPKKTAEILQNVIYLTKKIYYKTGEAKAHDFLGRIFYREGNYINSIAEFKRSSAIYGALDSIERVADLSYRTALCYNSLSQFETAIEHYKSSLLIYKKLKGNYRISDIYNNLGTIYDAMGNYDLAIDYYFKTYELDESLNRKNVLANDLNNIGQLFETIEIHDKAKEYLQKSIKLSFTEGDSSSLSYSYQSLATVYLNENKPEEALTYLNKSLALIQKIKPVDIANLSLNYADLGRAYLLKNKLDSAQYYLDKSFSYSNKNNIIYNEAYAFIYQARLYNLKKEFYKAKKVAQAGLQHANQIKSIPLKIGLLKELNIAFAKMGMFKNAYETQELEHSLSKELNSGKILQKITALLITIDFEKKESTKKAIRDQKELVIQNKLTNKNFFLIILMVISSFTIIIYIILYRNHKKQKGVNGILMIKNKEISKNQDKIKLQSDALLELNDTKDKLFTIISHDLRKPISQLSTIINLLENNLLNKEEIEYLIPSVAKNVKETSELLDSLLFWAKSQMKGFSLKLKETDLRDFANESVEILLAYAKEKDIIILNNIPQNLNIKLDQLLFNIIFRNLISNAIKFSNPGSEIILIYQEKPDFHLITIKDIGTGMSELQLNELFTPKVKSTMGTRNEIGSGLGLIFCKDLIEKSGGNIYVTSSLNQGSEFSFTILKN